jgi:hypothetical protein
MEIHGNKLKDPHPFKRTLGSPFRPMVCCIIFSSILWPQMEVCHGSSHTHCNVKNAPLSGKNVPNDSHQKKKDLFLAGEIVFV